MVIKLKPVKDGTTVHDIISELSESCQVFLH